MISRFFIDRPVAANVIAILTLLFGLLALRFLPVEQYPDITPPTIQVRASYPGASSQTLVDTVAAPIEQEVNGVEGMLYMSSNSSNDGSYGLTITFEIGTDVDTAQVLVQNRIAVVEPQLPEEVRRQGVTVRKQSTDLLLVVALKGEKGSYDSLFLSNYATLRLKDELSRIEGVGDVVVRGLGAYGMRIWFDPAKLDARGLTALDVVNALREQNVQVAAGQIAQQPTPSGRAFQYTVTTLGRLSDPKQFEDVVIKVDEDGSMLRLSDVARVELGAQSYDQFFSRSGEDAAPLLIYPLPGANSIDVAAAVREAMQQLSGSFPDGVTHEIPVDRSEFVSSSIFEVYKTLIEAGLLVLLVILVFLQDWRAVLVPATTVPVTIIGAFAVMPFLGFTVNTLTLFGLVLAIGIVVDDAIVIVENAAHHIERGMAPREATIKAMSEVTGPVMAITAVLIAVFLPTALMGGITGQLYAQFALTIAVTAVLSAINALTLKPAQCASWLRPIREKGRFSRAFDAVYRPVERAYAWLISKLVARAAPVLVAFVLLVGLTGFLYSRIPTGFLPTEDQGYLIANVQLPEAASQERTRKVVEQVDRILKATPGVEGSFVLGGFSMLDGSAASNAATIFINLDNWSERTTTELSQPGILGHLRRELGQVQDAVVFVFPPPSIRGLGMAGGFEMQIEDRGGTGLAELDHAVQRLLEVARQRPEVGQLNSSFRPGVPQLYVDIDRDQVASLNVALSDVFGTLQTALGSTYVNDFNRFGRTYQVRVQADAEFRDAADDVGRLKVRNKTGDMVALGTLTDVRETFGPQTIKRHNLYPTATVTGSAAQGYSSGETIELMERLAGQELSDSIGFDWSGIAFQEKETSGEVVFVFSLAILMVYLVLAFLYESWVVPLAVILCVPLGLVGAIATVGLLGMANNLYVQIGSVLIIALASKNAILIVEFARDLRRTGLSIREAAVEAAKLRFRPILMTSIAFILGVMPLALATGAGAASRRALGTAVVGGMLSATVLAVVFVPVFFVVFQWLSELRSGPPGPATADTGETPEPSDEDPDTAHSLNDPPSSEAAEAERESTGGETAQEAGPAPQSP